MKRLAYECAKRGARLALAARREDRLRAVYEKASHLGSLDAIEVRADVSKAEDCKQFVNKAVVKIGRGIEQRNKRKDRDASVKEMIFSFLMDHLVSNAGITHIISSFEDSSQLSEFAPAMDTNFWVPAYCSYFAIPRLRKTREDSCCSFNRRLVSYSKIDLLHVQMNSVPAESTDESAKAIVNSACRGDK
ncbi:11-beta-hydroxysteroid dehydrogenase-like 4A [Herrania umbratica]|uniref:11-beta-hydroxysteroid dehydrogenase-like 4A n=1 Tax=Herrania umbratica TaxID=108875 RepID=A0A6J1AHG1_9ROSI|nr:11-beta-hydroxysteroid dehydrogenase-like 4A [Herrania umbratica]